MKEIDFLIEILPIVVASLLGSVSNDAMAIASGQKSSGRILRILVSFLTSVFVVGFGLTSWMPGLDWKVLALSGYLTGFVGFKLANILGHSLTALKLIPGLSKISEIVEKAETTEKIQQLEDKLNDKNKS